MCIRDRFQIRLREIMKINAVPALVIGIGLALILFATGGTDNPLNYVVPVSYTHLFSGGDSGTGMSMQTVVPEINTEYLSLIHI